MRNFVRLHIRSTHVNPVLSMVGKIVKIAVCVLPVVFMVGCGTYTKVLKSKDKDLKYKAALEYFDQGKFEKTLQLLEDVAPDFQGTAREDTILFYTADTHFQSRDYESSAMLFDDFRRRFGRSPFLEEAEYKYAMCFYYMSPEPNRDQTATYMAIAAINEYLERYPESIKKQLCLVRIDELQGQLYDKSYLNAYTYYKIGRYKSAVMALKNALKEYPETPYREKILYMTVKSAYELAHNSVASLQRGRYLDMMDIYYTFVAEYPESEYRPELDKLQETARKFIAEHQTDEVTEQ